MSNPTDRELRLAFPGVTLETARRLHSRQAANAPKPKARFKPPAVARPRGKTVAGFAHLGAAMGDSPNQDADNLNVQEPSVPCDMCDGSGQFGEGECQACDGEGTVTAQQARDKADEILQGGKVARRAAPAACAPATGSLAAQIIAAGKARRQEG